MNPKQQAGEAALAFVSSNTIVGLGTGSTTDYFLIALGREIGSGKLTGIRGIPSSKKSEARAKELGIPLCDFKDGLPVVYVDGADEVDPKLQLVKGLGGALLREKICAQNSAKFVVIVDGGKKVQKLGTKSPLPVEVTQFSHDTHVAFFKSLGAEPVLRKHPDGSVYITDNSNYIYDCKFPAGIADPVALEKKLKSRAGVVETGLFIDIAHTVLVAGESGVETLKR